MHKSEEIFGSRLSLSQLNGGMPSLTISYSKSMKVKIYVLLWDIHHAPSKYSREMSDRSWTLVSSSSSLQQGWEMQSFEEVKEIKRQKDRDKGREGHIQRLRLLCFQWAVLWLNRD